MAKDKNSFVLYCDLIHTVRKLRKEDAGDLFLHILEYVNDNNPTTDNPIVDIAFEPIKQSLKRDLKKYEQRAERSRENGKKGGRPKNPKKPKKPSGLIQNPTEPKKPDSDSVSVSVSDIPKLDEFMAYGLAKMPDVNKESLSLKYESWKENGWSVNRQGKKQPIKNWKSTLLNTLPHLPKQPKKVRDLDQEFYENVMKQVNANK